MAEQVRPEERLFALVLTLLATESGLTKQQIFAVVRGYEPDSNGGANTESLERKFERDKADLRDLGVPIETLDSPEAPGDNQLLRYRIPREQYEFPKDLSLSAAELALLNVAGEVWREGTISLTSHRALTKLRALDIEPDAPLLGYVPRVRVREPIFDDFSRAIDAGERVRFGYLKPGQDASEQRDVTPFALGLVDGRWHLLGWDHDRLDERTFLLSRCTTGLSVAPGESAARPANAAERLVAGLEEVFAANVAELEIERGSLSASELLNRSHSTLVGEAGNWLVAQVHYLDVRIFAEELAGCGPEVRIVEPPELAEQVAELLSATRAHHGGPQ